MITGTVLPWMLGCDAVMGLEMFAMVVASSVLLVYGMVIMDQILYGIIIGNYMMDKKMEEPTEEGESAV